jgi:hypothetical protein
VNWLAENSLPIWMGGALALTMATIVYLQTRTNVALGAVVAVIVIAASLLAVEQFLETPREAVERTLYELAATVEANDVAGVLKFLAPSSDAQLRKDVETLLPQVTIERARVIGTPKIDVDDPPDNATVQCRGIILAVNKKDGMKGGGDDHLILEWVRSGDQWLLESYASDRNWHRELRRSAPNSQL